MIDSCFGVGSVMSKEAIVCNVKDNVATAIRDLQEGSIVEIVVGGRAITVKLRDNISFGHKFALEDIPKGYSVIKYGEPIGTATSEIRRGEWVHVHNLVSNRGRGDVEGG